MFNNLVVKHNKALQIKLIVAYVNVTPCDSTGCQKHYLQFTDLKVEILRNVSTLEVLTMRAHGIS